MTTHQVRLHATGEHGGTRTSLPLTDATTYPTACAQMLLLGRLMPRLRDPGTHTYLTVEPTDTTQERAR